VIVLDNMVRGRAENLIEPLQTGKVTLVVGDIRNQALLKELVQGVDTVFHQAAMRTAHCAAEPRAALEVMVDATFDLLDQCVAANVRKIVMASSASIYGMADAFPTAERHNPYSNRTLYGAAKCFSEGLMRAYNDMFGMNYVALRYFNVYGPRMDSNTRYTDVLIRWMERLSAGLPPIIFGNGRQTMDMLHVVDVARANVLAAISPATDVALNVGSGEESSLLRLARLLSQIMGRSDIEPVFWEERSAGFVSRRLADTQAARQTIGFETKIPLADGLTDLVAWWRSKQVVPRSAVG
jgi:UDP-glucose 4-epimerase